MMAQFMMDLKTEPRLSPSLYSPASPKMADPNCRPQSTDSGVLDLSKRRDSLDARKTPSPAYHCYSEVGGTPPPSNHSSPQQCDITVSNNPESTILLNYGELVRGRRLSPTKSLLHFEELAHHTQTQLAPAVQAFHRHGMGLPKPETDILQQHLLQQVHRAAPIPSYLLPPSALQLHPHHHQQQHQQTSPAGFSPSPIRLRELDALSESGSESTSLVSSSQRKCKDDGTNTPKDSSKQYPMVVGRDGKLSRPFKAYPRDPLSLAAGFVASDTILDTNSAEKYNLFRKRMLEQIHAANGGQPTVSNPKMRRLANSTKSGNSSSNAPSAAMSDASSSESCDEKSPSNERHVLAMAAAKAHQNLTTCDEMTQYAATNQRQLVTPSRKDTREMACDVIGSSDASVSSRAESNAAVATAAEADAGSASQTPSNGSSVKDSAYYERRKKNNAAAKKSRDRRRIKEDEIAIRAAFLERENIELKFELAAARKQLALYGVTSSVAAS
ncbi:protein giant [Anopheles maculipalpis]|uniref:protein giant n=1 Tax=Anopheles maculipalpis TaxID=1496333 RepID=UPI0021592372|nr:protein giant [Anopheles maculipalpis]